MPRKLIKRWMPDPQKVREMKSLRFLGTLLHDPNLFHLNRHSVSVAFFIGLFCAFLPIPTQMWVAAALALWLRSNLPLSVGLVWITNPVTIPPIFYAVYKLGTFLLDTPPGDFSIELSWTWVQTEFLRIWKPLLLGSLICSLTFGTLGYFAMQGFWRWHVSHHWQLRRKRREKRLGDLPD